MVELDGPVRLKAVESEIDRGTSLAGRVLFDDGAGECTATGISLFCLGVPDDPPLAAMGSANAADGAYSPLCVCD